MFFENTDSCRLLIRRALRYITSSLQISEMMRAMITNSGATPNSESFRPLNPPIPIEVRETGHQTPRAINIKGRWRKVVSIVDVCNLDEEWWREKPIVRMYYRVILENETQITVFRDMLDGAWYRQNA
jgi:hypothetical protein